jgi:guanylate kinase
MTHVFIVSAPSGSGKSTLVNEVLTRVPGLNFSISYTTRSPRGSEQGGREYHFVSREEFEAMAQRGDFLEHAEVHGKYYGTAKVFLQRARDAGKDLLLDIDVQGASQIKQKLPEAVSVFVLPPDRQTLERRLRNRSSDSEQEIRRRLDTATREIENYSKYDYILVNDRLEDSTEALRAILLAERLRRSGAQVSAADLDMIHRAECWRLAHVRDRVQPILKSFRENGAAGGC